MSMLNKYATMTAIVLLASTLARSTAVLGVFGGTKAVGEYLKLNGVIQEARILLGGNDTRAEDYYRSQKPIYNNSTDFELRRSWAQIGFPRTDATWEELISFRVQRMAEFLEKDDIRDFLIEKDKCFMYNFFKSQGIPFVPIYGIFSNRKAAASSVQSILKSVGEGENSMIFIKACHLTQGSDNGTLRVQGSTVSSKEGLEDISKWITTKFDQIPTDNWRPWSPDMNKLLSTVRPGVMIQESFVGPFGDFFGGYPKPVEAKVEVIWGKAYLSFLHDYKVFTFRDGTTERYREDLNGNVLHNSEPDTQLSWLYQKDYMTPVYKLAELVAKKIGIDQIRVDIFITPGSPDRPVVNEISLASGVLYRFHGPRMARLWIDGHIARGVQQSTTLTARNSNFWLSFLISGGISIVVLLALGAVMVVHNTAGLLYQTTPLKGKKRWRVWKVQKTW